MDGIETITSRIASDAQAEADQLLLAAKAQAEATKKQFEAQAAKETEEIVARGRAAAQERWERLESVAQMEGKKLLLATRQELIGKAFDRALEKLLTLPEDKYVELLAGLCVKASTTCTEKVVFSPKDKKRVGAKVVQLANEQLLRKTLPPLPTDLKNPTAKAFLDTVVSAGTALLQNVTGLTLADETRPIQGGFILVNEGVEVNCAFDTLVRLSRPELERQVAELLFAE